MLLVLGDEIQMLESNEMQLHVEEGSIIPKLHERRRLLQCKLNFRVWKLRKGYRCFLLFLDLNIKNRVSENVLNRKHLFLLNEKIMKGRRGNYFIPRFGDRCNSEEYTGLGVGCVERNELQKNSSPNFLGDALRDSVSLEDGKALETLEESVD